ncbi:MAG: hypothetical protein M3R08_06880, partial [Bacteroidota bacterium]|nr:hypothetical protein [Bacteroidota bacterium]
ANATLCTGESLLLDAAVPGGTYLWQNGSTNSSFQVNAAGNYSVTVTANGCSASDAITVNYLPLPQVDLGPDQILCEGETTVLDPSAGPGATYSWQDGSTASTYTVTGPGNYMVNVTQNGCSASDAVQVSYNSLPLVDLGVNQTICAGDQVIFNVTTLNATYLWQDGSTGPTFTANSAGQVSVAVTVNGCTASDATNVIVNPVPVVDIGPDQSICPGISVTLNATLPGATYLWTTGSTAASITVNTAGTYSVAVTVNGCTVIDTIIIDEYALPTVDLGDDLSFCEGGSVQLGSAIANATFLWSTGETTSTITVDAAGTYSLEVTQNSCVVSDQITVTEIPLPVVDLGPAPVICPGSTVTLDATTPGASYIWSSSEIGPSIEAGVGTHSVEVTVNGCTSTAAITVTEFTVQPVSLGNDTTLCPGEQLTLDASQNNATYSWQNGSNSSTYLVTNAGTHSVIVTDQNGCISTDEILVSYASPTSVDLGPDITICEGEDLVLDATLPGAAYLWSNGTITPTITVNSAGQYEVTVSQGNCPVSDQIQVQIAAAPVVFLGNDTTLCPGASLVLNADQPGSAVVWSTGSFTQSITVTQAGTYSVTVTNLAGCSSTASINVAFATPDAVDLGPDVSICDGESIQLDATLPSAAYLWNTGAVSSSIAISTAGTYWVEVSQAACSNSDTVVVSVQPAPAVDLGNDVSLCSGEAIILDAIWPGAGYAWNTGAISPSITVDQSGTYSVTVDLNGCVATDEIVVSVIDLASIELGPDLTACSTEQIVLDASADGATHLWSMGATTPTLSVASSGTYWVNVNLNDCVVTDSIDITINPSPAVDLGSDQVLCAGDATSLDASWPGADISWSTGETTPILSVSESGVYSVIVDLNGCTATDAVEITFLDPPAIDLGEDAQLCAGEDLLLDAISGGDHLWSTGSTEASITVNTSGTYWVQITQGSCIATDSIIVSVNDPGTIDLGSDQEICEGESITLDATLTNATYLWQDGLTAPVRSIINTGIYSIVATVG